MKPIQRGIAVTALQCLIVLSVAGKYAADRERLPRAWAKAVPVDPNLPVRGRYLSVRLELEGPRLPNGGPVQLHAEGSRLAAKPADAATRAIAVTVADGHSVLAEPVAFFLPEHAADPSHREVGEELWMEVSVPAKGAPRPLRLGVKKDGVLTPLNIR